MSEENALLIDPSVVGQSHILVNTGMVCLAASRYTRVTVIAESTHCDALEQYLDLNIASRVTFIPWSRRAEIRSIVRKLIAKDRFDLVLFTNLEYGIFVYMNVFHRGITQRPILWTLHSHLVNLGLTSRVTRIKNFVKWYFLFCAFRKVKFIALGGRIRANIETAIGPLFYRSNIAALMHPVGIRKLPGPALDASDIRTRSPRVIFMSGWHGLSPKNKELLGELERLDSSSSRFELVSLSNSFKSVSNQKVKSFAIDYADRLKEITKADFFLHLPSDPYRLHASGALMDMLLTGTPIIGLRTDFGEELAEIIGPFGYFFDKHDEVLRFFSSSDFNPAEFDQFRSNLAAGYEKIVALNQTQFDDVLSS